MYYESDYSLIHYGVKCVKLGVDVYDFSILSNELYHYGIKGQKWGVRRFQDKNGRLTIAGKKRRAIQRKRNTVVKKAIESGRVSKTINEDKQLRHIKGDQVVKGVSFKGRSCIDGNLKDAQQLVNKLSGTGKPVFDRHGVWQRKERVEDAKIIGTLSDGTKTKKAMIVYSKTGSHIMPRK